MKKIVTMKDLVYWIIMLVMIIVFLIVLFFTTDTDLVSYFGFSGTITGIILAVVALIYTFYQNITLGSANTKLDEFAKRTSEFSDHLRKLNTLETIPYEIGLSIDRLNISTSESIQAINSAVQQLEVTVTSELRSQREHIDQRFYDFQATSSPFTENMFEGQNNTVDSDQSLSFLVNSLPPFILIGLYIFIKGREEGRLINTYSYLKWSYEAAIVIYPRDPNKEKDIFNPNDENIVLLAGFFHYFRLNNWADVSGSFLDGTLKSINDSFNNIIQQKINTDDYIQFVEILENFYSNK